MNEKARDTDALILEILYFNAGLRSLTFYSDSKNPRSRPDWLPTIESVGLDNDLTLQDSDIVIDFSYHEANDNRLRSNHFCWLGVYKRSVDTVGDRGNFIGAGIWITSGFAVHHQMLIASLIALLGELSNDRESLIDGNKKLLDDLADFRRKAENLKIKSNIYQNIPVKGRGEIDRAYLKIDNSSNGEASTAGIIGTLLLDKTAQIAPRTLFLIGPALPLPRRGWKLYKNSTEYTRRFSETDFIFETVLADQSEFRDENETLKIKKALLFNEIKDLEEKLKHSENQKEQLKIDHGRLSGRLESLEFENSELQQSIIGVRHERQLLADRLKSMEQVKAQSSTFNADFKRIEILIQDAKKEICTHLKEKLTLENTGNIRHGAANEISIQHAEQVKQNLRRHTQKLTKLLYISIATLSLAVIMATIIMIEFYTVYIKSPNADVQSINMLEPSSTPSILKENNQMPPPASRPQEETMPPSAVRPQ